MDPISEELETESVRPLSRHVYNECTSNGREESALLSSHSPIPSVNRRGEHEPRRFYGGDDNGGAWE